jgi:hypothetical protein
MGASLGTGGPHSIQGGLTRSYLAVPFDLHRSLRGVGPLPFAVGGMGCLAVGGAGLTAIKALEALGLLTGPM